jgi:ATP-dependent DNA helicase RecQ
MKMDLAKEALKKYFGYDTFRPMQAEIIQAIYDRKDSLVLMPTGGGKSICYQIPAVTLPGVCVVVSPLISLMKDQVEGLLANGIQAAYLNSSLDNAEQRRVEDAFFKSEIDLLYVSPEKLASAGFLPLLQKARINLFAIDEAHCISAWGHDFRQEYTQMRFLKKQFPTVPIVALTATADKITRRDIIRQLELPKPEVFIASFDRPNLRLEVRPAQQRLPQILDFIRKRPKQPGIIYALSRKSTEDLARKLQAEGVNAAAYHAGLSSQERNETQEAFINDHTAVICATIAFGMGIDKSNVRWIIHYNLPKNIESYYQEIGRAGRDGARADTLLFYNYADALMLQDIIQKNEGEQTEIQLDKLERMRQYAESLACRRRILLNYFAEDHAANCGNCDICQNPPTYFDGTVIAQKALSAIYRLREKAGLNLLVDILRGSQKRQIFERGYHNIKTYGAGRDISFNDWRYYLQQLLNLGYLEVAADQHKVLRLTPASSRVLFEKEKVELVRLTTLKERQEKDKSKAQTTIPRQRTRNELFEQLRQLRRKLAQQRGIPPYLIFSDATLEEMAAQHPVSDLEMRAISGVGERKMHLYGDLFMEMIRNYLQQEMPASRHATHDITRDLYLKGLDPETIARRRELSPGAIYDHLARLYESGETIDIHRIVSPGEINQIDSSLRYLEKPYGLKDIFEYHNGRFDYGKIKLALAYRRRLMADS